MRRSRPLTVRRLALVLALVGGAVVSLVEARPQDEAAATATLPATLPSTSTVPTTSSTSTTVTTTTLAPATTTTTVAPLAPAPPGFVEAVQAALADPRFEAATVGLAVWVEGLGMVVSHNAEMALRPGSNEKLLVAWGAYGVLGATGALLTEVRAAGEVAGNTLAGDLVLVGGGDPTLRSTGPHSLDRLAQAVRAAGITYVTGDLVVDESRFDGQRKAPGWTERHVPNFVGPLSAVAVDFNVHRTDPEYLAHPALGNLNLFRAALQARGVTVAGGERAGPAPEPAPVIAALRSPPVAGLVAQMLTNSDNFVAEMLLKAVGYYAKGLGSWDNGVAAVRELALEAGVALTGRAADGSGLSRENSRPAREWAELLAVARDQPWFDSFLGGLAVAGRTGTLANRFLGTPAAGNVRAKTGSVREARALSGYLTTAGGRRVVFSLVVNSNPVPVAVIAAMDGLVASMAASAA